MFWTALTAPGAAVGPAALFAPDAAAEPAPARPVRNNPEQHDPYNGGDQGNKCSNCYSGDRTNAKT